MSGFSGTPTVSIAMATFNGAAHIQEQLDSIAAQRLKPIEIIISDDGSTDETLGIVEKFAKKSQFAIKMVRNPVRLGFRNNFLNAANLCEGELIAFCDQDDVWHRDKLICASRVFDDEEVMLVHHDAIVINNSGNTLGSLHQWRKPAPMMPANSEDPWRISHGFTQMFRRVLCAFNPLWSLSLDPDRPDSKMAHDQWMFFLATCLGRTAHIDRPLARYRQHVTNAAGWIPTVGLMRRVVMRFEDRTDVYARCRDAAAQRFKILSKIEESASSAFLRGNANIAKKRYQVLEALYAHRHSLYNSPSFSKRLARFSDLLQTGAYSKSGPFTFTYKGAFKDLTLGLAFGNLTRRFGAPPSGGDPTCRAAN